MDSNAAAGHSVDVAKKFRPYSPDQAYLLPPSPRDWLDSGHLAYFILDVIDELDLGRIYDHYERELRGKPPHDPRLMVALLLYGYCVGVRSSRQIEKKTYEDVAFRVLAAETHPDHVSISEFRRVHRERLAELFGQVFQLCREAGLVKLGHFSLDGTKVKANASKHKAMSYRRMKQAQGELVKRARALLDLAEQTDRKEDTEFDKGKRGDELPEELRRTETRLARIREAKRKLEAEAKAAREQQQEEKAAKVARKHPPNDQDGDGGSGGVSHDELPAHRVPSESNGKPTEKAQRNFTDPDSRIMKAGSGAFVQGYNAQIVVDEAHQIIVAEAVTNQAPDVEHAVPLMAQAGRRCGALPDAATMDAGYFSESNVFQLLALGFEPYIATGRRAHGEALPSPRGRPPNVMPVHDWMARRLATQKGAAIYRRRKATSEPVFGQLKDGGGMRSFLLRGLEKVRCEWSFACTAHNLRKLFRARRLALTPS